MATYGSIEGARELLRATPQSSLNVDQEERLIALQAAVSALIEHETGRTFGEVKAESVLVHAPGVSDLLVLPKGIRTISSIAAAIGWDGAAFTPSVAIDPTLYRPVYQAAAGDYLALASTSGGYWWGDWLITGVWGDAAENAEVPGDIQYIATFLIAERFKAEQAGASGQIGPDGQIIPLRNALKDPFIVKTLEHYRAGRALMAV